MRKIVLIPIRSYRMFRGGSWNFHTEYCRVVFRGRGTSEDRCGDLDFRLVQVPYSLGLRLSRVPCKGKRCVK